MNTTFFRLKKSNIKGLIKNSLHECLAEIAYTKKLTNS